MRGRVLLTAPDQRSDFGPIRRLWASTRHPAESPAIAASLISAAFFGVMYAVLQHGYWMNDDLKIIWNIVGYPGGSGPIPFMIHSNVLLGFLLAALYSLPTDLNWEMHFFATLDVLAVWALLYCVFTMLRPLAHRLVAAMAILAGYGTLTLNITYTFTAVLVALAGVCLMLSAARNDGSARRWEQAAGIALVVASTLIRIRAIGLVLIFAVPALPFLRGSIRWRPLLATSLWAAVLAGAAFAADRLYVRAAPEWNRFYAYNHVREQLHDAHRLANLHNQIRRVGWTPNDQELFAHWFFPDSQIYSFDHIQYLVDHVPGSSQDLGASGAAFVDALANPRIFIYTGFLLAILLLTLGTPRPSMASLGVMVVAMVAVGENFLLTWAYKDPDYVLLSTLNGSLVLGLLLLARRPVTQGTASPLQSLRRPLVAAAVALVSAASILSLLMTVYASRENAAKQRAYRGIEADLQRLQVGGLLPPGALIISPAHGLPFEWSAPFQLDLPRVSYLDTGWITFSPPYERLLRTRKMDPLPDMLYRKTDIFLMTRSSFTPYLARYFAEHEAINVDFVPLYAMPNTADIPGYDDIFLYRVVAVK